MKFEELKRSLKENVKQNYLLFGGDLFLLDVAYKNIVEGAKIDFKQINEIKFNELEVDFEKVVSALNTLPAFTDKKIVFVNLSIRNIKVNNIDMLNKYLENPNAYSVLVINVGEEKSAVKINIAKFVEVDCSKISPIIAKKYLEKEITTNGKTISNKALNLLFEYSLGNMALANNEVKKLVNFVGDRKNIEVKDIEEIVPQTMEFQVFELTESLATKNIKKTYNVLENFKTKKDGYKNLVGLIYSHFRRLFHIAITNYTVGEYSQYFGIKEFAVSKSIQQAKLFSKRKLKAINDMCVELDFHLKQSKTNVNTAVDRLVLYILNN